MRVVPVPSDTRFPFEPLEEVLRRRLGELDNSYQTKGFRTSGLNSLPIALRQSYYRCKNSGYVPLKKADEFAYYLGLHPGEIWETYWEIAS